MLAAFSLHLEKISGKGCLDIQSKLHAWFLSEISRKDPTLGKAAHMSPYVPFNISLIKGPQKQDKDYTELTSDKYRITISAIGERTSENAFFIIDDLIRRNREISLGKLILKPVSYKKTTIQKEDLLNSKPTNRFNFKFLSPTAFSKGKEIWLFPDPWSLFGGFLRKWNFFFPEESFNSIEREDVDENIRLECYNLSTSCVYIKGRIRTGFTGSCSYSLSRACPKEVKMALNVLAGFAPYAGAGIKTPMGMGSLKLLN